MWPQDNDRVVISSDEELAEAVALATRAGKDRLTLHVTVDLSSAAANASSASYVGSAAMLGNRGPSGSSLPAGGGAMDDDAKENAGSSNVGAAPRAAPGKTFAGQAAHLAGAAMVATSRRQTRRREWLSARAPSLRRSSLVRVRWRAAAAEVP